MSIKKITVRVYGLIINKKKEILLTDEYAMDMKMTKFPGGGLELGEGTIDTLHREALEEFGQDIIIKDHFYTTDFFQQAITRPEYQLLSIYYLADFKEKPKFKTTKKRFDFKELKNGSISFRWKKIELIHDDEITLPIDKIVLKKIKNQYYNK